MDWIERLEIPTPFNIGPVNCYLLSDGALTVIDPGPATEEAIELLSSGLDGRGYTIRDIDKILITHPHIDHFGIANRLVSESGATVFAHEYAADRLADPIEYFHREQAFFGAFLQTMGVPNETVDTVTELPEPYIRFQEPVSIDVGLTDGDMLDVGYTVETLHTPGHSPESVCYILPEFDSVFTGDHIMEEITPNPLLTLDPEAPDGRTRSLPTYMESLRGLRERDVQQGLAGHREPIPDVAARIDETVAHHRDRKESIYATIEAVDSMTAYEVMQSMFPDLPAVETFAGMSEAIGHLDLLEDENRIERVEFGTQIEYRQT